MIPAPIDRAVVEIIDAGKTLGTGSVVSADGLVLTATHVVGARASITVRFIDDETDTATFVEAGAPDWSLFRLTKAPPIDPIVIGTLDTIAKDVRWCAVGFANIRRNQRGGFHGIVRREVPTFELFCEELTGQSYEDARGLSGAPCIVDGEAVAMITDVLRQNATGAIITGQVEAVPLGQIKPTTVSFGHQSADRLPWELAFLAPLQQVTDAERLMLAGTMRIKNPIQSPSLAKQIARRMISQGIDTTARAMWQIRRLGDAVVDEIMELADTLWVRGIAAASFAQITASGVGVIETDFDWCAKHHLMRAYDLSHTDRFSWRYVFVSNAYSEPVPQTVVKKTYEALRAIFTSAVTDDDVKRKLGKQVVAAFVIGTPRADVAKALRDEFSSLIVVFLSRAKPAVALPPGFVVVSPSVTTTDEHDIGVMNEDARDTLTGDA